MERTIKKVETTNPFTGVKKTRVLNKFQLARFMKANKSAKVIE